MIEERIEAYLAVIGKLLTCAGGEELEILNANLDLVDAGLVQTMELVSAKLSQEGNEDAAVFLQEFGAQLTAVIEQASAPTVTPEGYINFLGEVLQLVSENPDPQVVYPLLQANADKLDGFLAQLLQSWAATTLPEVDAQESQGIAGAIGNFSNLIQQFPGGDKENNLEIAITGYEIASVVFTATPSQKCGPARKIIWPSLTAIASLASEWIISTGRSPATKMPCKSTPCKLSQSNGLAPSGIWPSLSHSAKPSPHALFKHLICLFYK